MMVGARGLRRHVRRVVPLVVVVLVAGLCVPLVSARPALATGLTPVIPPTSLTPLTTDEAVVADAVATYSPYSADDTGASDATSAIQTALDDVHAAGGGVVYLPDGTYRIDGFLTVPNNTTLRGDWTTPGSGAAAGTILEANDTTQEDNAAGTPFVTLDSDSNIRNLSIWYTHQGFTSATIHAYPYTIASTERGDNIQNVTLFNSYQGVSLGYGGGTGAGNGISFITNLYATCLQQCVTVDHDDDFGYLQGVNVSSDIWYNAPSVVTTKPSNSTDVGYLNAYTSANLVGVILRQADSTTVYDVHVADALHGISIQASTDGAVYYGALSKVTEPLDIQATPPSVLLTSTTPRGYVNTDDVLQGSSLSYSFAATSAPTDKTDLYNVMTYGAYGDGTHNDTGAINAALSDAAVTGGTVYLPAGTYLISTHLDIPSNVELRGSFDGRHEFEQEYGGTVLKAVENQNDTSTSETDTAFITLEHNSGVRGVSVYYPNQDESSVSTYPYTFRSNGVDTWLTDVEAADSYNFADFASAVSSGFVIRDVFGTVLNKGIVVGDGTDGGSIEDAWFHYGAWWQAAWPNSPQEVHPAVATYTEAYTQAFILDGCSNLNLFNAASFNVDAHLQIIGTGCSNTLIWASNSDDSQQPAFQIDAGTGYTIVGAVVAAQPGTTMWLTTPTSGFSGPVTVYGSLILKSDLTRSGTDITEYPQSGGCGIAPGWNLLEPESGTPNALQETSDDYGGYSVVFYVVTTPSPGYTDQQKWEVIDTGGGYCALSTKADPANSLQETSDPYNGISIVFYVVTTPRCCGADQARWQITDLGGGYFDLSSKADPSHYLQETADTYNSVTGVYYVVTTPTLYTPNQKWQFVPTS